MTLGDKISKLRKGNNYTQEQLASILGVSRQAISKWESNVTYPETDKLIRMSELFDCSLDYLLKDEMETDHKLENENIIILPFRKKFRERKSEKTVWGMPLGHIGKKAKGVVAVGVNASGIIAIGLKAQGILSIGALSIGILSFGMLPIGLLAVGLLAFGVFSAGCFSVGIFAAGAISFGILSFGAIAIGDFSAGALAIGKYAAIGDYARAMIALGDTQAAGSVYQKLGELNAQEIADVGGLLDTIVPPYFSWAAKIIKLLL